MKRYYLTLLCGLLCAFFISASLQAATPALELAASKKSYDLTQPWKFSKTLSWINLPANPKCTTCGALRRLSNILLKLVPYSSGMKKVCLCIKREMLFEATLISKISLYVRNDKVGFFNSFHGSAPDWNSAGIPFRNILSPLPWSETIPYDQIVIIILHNIKWLTWISLEIFFVHPACYGEMSYRSWTPR